MIAHLEDLPNELLWFILEYIPPFDLFHQFFNLNKRFNMLLRLLHYNFDLQYTNQNEFNYYVNKILPNIECSRVESCFIDDMINRLDLVDKFQRLGSLKIYQLHTENISILANGILGNLKQLKYLYLHSEFRLHQKDVSSLTSVIFSSQMPSLTNCYFAFQDYGRMSFDHLNDSNKTYSLNTLVIDQWCRLRDFVQLLHFIPSIRHLTVRLFDSNLKGTIPSSLVSINDFTTLVPNLIYLRAKLAEIPFSVANTVLFLPLPSKLRELSLSTWSMEYANADAWQTLISTKFPCLTDFRLIISLDRIPQNLTSTSESDLNDVAKLFNQSKYFIDHKWTVLINANDEDRLKFVLHTVPYPIENFQTTLYNIRRCTSSSTIIKKAYRYVRKLSLTLQASDRNSSLISSDEYRHFPNVEQLILYSNILNDCQRFPSTKYFNNLKQMVDLSSIAKLECPEETRQYPKELIGLLLQSTPRLTCLTIPYRLYKNLDLQSVHQLKHLTLVFSMYSSVYPPVTRMRHLLTRNQILVNELISELVITSSSAFPHLQTLMLIVRDLEGFDNHFSEWLKTKFSIEQNISHEFILQDNIVRFFF